MPHPDQLEPMEQRVVRSEDPSLTDEANELLTEELREVVGRDTVEVRAGTPRRHERARGGHHPIRATLISNRELLVVAFFVALTVGGIVTIVTGSWWALVAACAIHALGTMLVAASAIQLTTQTEHMSPGTAARLENEGVGDPDRVLTELVEDFSGVRTAAGTAQVVSSGYNEQTVQSADEPAIAAVQQRTSMTPTSEPAAPGGSRSAVAALPWWVTTAMMVLSLAFAVIIGGNMWVLPAIVLPIGAGWIMAQRRMDSAGEEEAGSRHRHEPDGARHPTDERGPAARRLVPIGVAVVTGVVAFMVVMGVITGLI